MSSLSTVRGRLLTEDLMNAFLKLIATGNYPGTACRLLGISSYSYNGWMTLGAQDDEQGIYKEFYNRVKQAEAAAEAFAVKKWTAQLDKNYQASRDFLARRYPARWSEKIEISVIMRNQLEEMISRLQVSLSSEVFAQVMAALASDQVFIGYMEMERAEAEDSEREVSGGL